MDEWRALDLERVETAVAGTSLKLHQIELLRARELAVNASESRINEIDEQRSAIVAERRELLDKLEKARRL